VDRGGALHHAANPPQTGSTIHYFSILFKEYEVFDSLVGGVENLLISVQKFGKYDGPTSRRGKLINKEA